MRTVLSTTRRRILLIVAMLAAFAIWIGLPTANTARSGKADVAENGTRANVTTPATGEPTASGSLTVIVGHRIGNTPLAHVSLEVAGAGGVIDLGAPRTDRHGRFNATLPPGEYAVEARLGSAYARSAFTVKRQVRTEVMLTLDGYPCVVIRGVVRGADGHGVPNVSVTTIVDAETLPPDFDKVNRNERVMKTRTDRFGNYELAGTLMPASCEIMAVGSLIERGAADWPVVRVEPDKGQVERSFDLHVRHRVYVELAGRVLTPEHLACEGARVVGMLQTLNDAGQVVRGTESVASTDAAGRFSLRAGSGHITFKILHALYRTASLQMATGLDEFANKIRPLPDFILQPKSTRIDAWFKEESTGKSLAGDWHVLEASSEFGNGYFTISSNADGRVSFLVEAGTRYFIQRQGYKLVSIKGCVEAVGWSPVQFPEQGGELEILVRRQE